MGRKGPLAKPAAKQRKRGKRGGGIKRPNGPALVLTYRLRKWHLHDAAYGGEHRRRRHCRFSDNGSAAPLEREIGEIDLRQNQNEREQEEFEQKQSPTTLGEREFQSRPS